MHENEYTQVRQVKNILLGLKISIYVIVWGRSRNLGKENLFSCLHVSFQKGNQLE